MIKYTIAIIFFIFSLSLLADDENIPCHGNECEGNQGHIVIPPEAEPEDPDLVSPDINIRIVAKFRKLSDLNTQLTDKFAEVNENISNLEYVFENQDKLATCEAVKHLKRKLKSVKEEIQETKGLLSSLKDDLSKNDPVESKKDVFKLEENIFKLEENISQLIKKEKMYENASKKGESKARYFNCKK